MNQHVLLFNRLVFLFGNAITKVNIRFASTYLALLHITTVCVNSDTSFHIIIIKWRLLNQWTFCFPLFFPLSFIAIEYLQYI